MLTCPECGKEFQTSYQWAIHTPGCPLRYVNKKLRPYQVEGVSFLIKHHRAFLADEMGLGKTVQTLEAIRLLKLSRVLAVVPKSAIGVWEDEIKKWGIPLEVISFSTERKKGDKIVARVQDRKHSGFILLATYHPLLKELEKVYFDAIVLDEAHRVRGRNTQTYRIVKALATPRSNGLPFVFMLSGTPIVGHPHHVIPLVQILDPRGNRSFWKRVAEFFGIVITPFGTEIAPPDPTSNHYKRFTEWLSQYMLSRRRTEIAKELPTVETQIVHLELAPELEKVYKKLQVELKLDLDQETLALPNVVAMLTKLRIFLMCPRAILPTCVGLTEPIDCIAEQVREHSTQCKVVVFSPFLQPLQDLSRRLMFGDSEPIPHVVITGQSSAKEVTKFSKQFREDPEVRVALCSIGMAEGFSLAGAELVLVWQLDWNYNTVAQALARVVRPSGKVSPKPVLVRYFVHRGKLDERILELVQLKKQWSDIVNELKKEVGCVRI